GVAGTGHWTWHGWQTDLADAMKTSLTESMSTRKPVTDEDAEAMVAFTKTLEPSVTTRAGTTDEVVLARIEAGRRVFEGGAGGDGRRRGSDGRLYEDAGASGESAGGDHGRGSADPDRSRSAVV